MPDIQRIVGRLAAQGAARYALFAVIGYLINAVALIAVNRLLVQSDGVRADITEEDIAAAWARVVWECGCPDIYYCPQSKDIECPRHSGFGVCCDAIEDHVPMR